MEDITYPDLKRFSEFIGIPAENLVKAFEIEKIFHKKILQETSFDKRKEMYREVYNTVHSIYGKAILDPQKGKNPKDEFVQLFKKELKGKSVLDVGCGVGYLLASISNQLKHQKLVGLDVSIPPLAKQHPEIEFISGDIIEFNLGHQFDVVVSDQVLEHIAPIDLAMHLKSVRLSLKAGGIFIVRLPNKLFGPHDVTRIIDFSNTGKTKAEGTHLNESTYGEIIPILEKNGFNNIKTPLPRIPKLGYMLRTFRINPQFFVTIEKSKFLMNILHKIKYQFGIILICKKY